MISKKDLENFIERNSNQTKQGVEEKLFPTEFTFVDLFAGIGGFRLALEDLGGKCVFSSDWDEAAQITYKTNFREMPAGDITKIHEKNIPSHNVLCAGFPCQAFSISGKQRGFEDTRGTLFFDIARIAKYHQPEILFLENVKHFVRHDKGRTLQVVLTSLDQIGYNVFYKILNASHYGLPQSRKRVYFVCFRKNLGVKDFNFPAPTYESVKLKDILEINSKARHYIIERDDIKLNDRAFRKQKKFLNKNCFSPIRVGTINKGGQGERIYSVEGHAITLSAYGGGAGSKTGAYLVDGVVRKLTPRECARAMGFPDNFNISVNDTQAYKLFGNSIPVPVVKKIFKQVIKTLRK